VIQTSKTTLRVVSAVVILFWLCAAILSPRLWPFRFNYWHAAQAALLGVGLWCQLCNSETLKATERWAWTFIQSVLILSEFVYAYCRGHGYEPLVVVVFVAVVNVAFPLMAAFAPTVVARRVRRWREPRHPEYTCTCCHYDLTGNTSGICPECGAPVDADQEAADRRYKARWE